MKAFYLFIVECFLTSLSFASTYYVAVNGNNSNSGASAESPLASITTAISRVTAGDTILIKGGIYPISTTISISKSGTETDTCHMLAYENEKPVLDFSGTALGKRGMTLSGSYWKIKGLEMKNAGDNALNISGNNNTIEFCSFHDNKDSGLQMGGGAHDNKIINCDSYFNADPTDYGDADGFAGKLDVGTNNYFYGCRAWLNCDDGWDGYMRGNDDVSTTLVNCWTWSNGYFKDGTDAGAKANGNGFKVGGSDDKLLKHNFTLINCLAFYNKAKGFDQNSNMGSMLFYNCTGYGNVGNDYSVSTKIATGKIAEIKNCVLFNGKKNVASFVVMESNSWDPKFTVDTSDFISVDTTGISGPRKSDGSLPDIDFMHLAKGSDLIDAGINLGNPFNGKAPDLGAFETKAEVRSKTLAKASTIKVYRLGRSSIAIEFEQKKRGDAIISICNLNGKRTCLKIMEQINEGAQKISMPTPSTRGIYFININSNNESLSTKIVFD